MTLSTTLVVATSAGRPVGAARCALALVAVWPLAAALAATPADSPTVAGMFSFARTGAPAGNGLTAPPATGLPETAMMPPNRAARAGGSRASAFDGAMSRLDAGHRNEAFEVDAVGSIVGDRLLVRSRLHLTRPVQGAGLRLSRAEPYRAFPDIALAWRLRHDLAVGAEYRFRPDNRNPAGPFGTYPRDGAWKDVFVAWSPTSRFSLTASYVDLGRISPALGGGRQIGRYLAAEFWY